MKKLPNLRCGLLILASLLYSIDTRAQIGSMKMRDSTLVVAKIIVFSPTHVQTTRGSFEVAAIYLVSFEGAEVKKAKPFIEKFRKGGVIVQLNSQSLLPLAPPPQTDITKSETPAGRSNSDQIDKMEVGPVPHGGFGVGIGIDYGGLGARGTAFLSPNIDVFLAAGYALAGLGVNGGFIFNLSPTKKVNPTLSLMYGYNAAIFVRGGPQYNELYYGLSLGAGLKFKSGTEHLDYWHVGLILPFRPSNFDDDLANLKKNPAVNIFSEPWPVLFSVGYHFGYGK